MTNPDKIKALIVDDSIQARELLNLMLQELAPNIEVVGEAGNVKDAVTLIKSIRPAVVFLDIEMPGKSGLQLVDEISRDEAYYEIIFTTAYNEYAIQAFRLSAIDYLLKPIRESELLEAIKKLSEKKDQQHNADRLKALAHNLVIQHDNILCIPVNYGYEYIRVDEIEHIEADRAYSYLYMKDGQRNIISKSLKYFEDTLAHIPFFVKVHRSYIINIHYITSFSKAQRGVITLQSGKKTELSRSQRKSFMEIIAKLKK